jgi:hypothetical protein
MAMPTAVKSWAAGLLPNQRITFVSLLTTLGTYITGIANQLISRGYTCVGSSNGVTAAMDGVNRCTTPSGFAVRAANTTTAQSWIVISDGVTQTLFTFTGASDDIARISFSPGSLFVVAGTATFAPTATDEQVFISTVSLIGATASSDRVFTVWVDSTHRLWRAAIFRASIVAAPLIGTELFDASPLIGVSALPAVWGFAQAASLLAATNSAGAYSANAVGGLCKTSGNASTQLGGTILAINGALNDPAILTANGSLFAVRSLGLASVSGGCVGIVGNRFDWYASSDSQVCGALGGAATGKDWVQLNNSSSGAAGVLWPWDGVTASCVTA